MGINLVHWSGYKMLQTVEMTWKPGCPWTAKPYAAKQRSSKAVAGILEFAACSHPGSINTFGTDGIVRETI